MRRILGGLTVLVTVGACALGLWAGVGRAAGPMPAVPQRDALESPIVLATESITAPIVETAAPVEPVPPTPAESTPPVEPVATTAEVAAAPAATAEPEADAEGSSWRPAELSGSSNPAPAPERAVVVSCGVGPEGSFVAVASVADCPGSAALVVEATTDA